MNTLIDPPIELSGNSEWLMWKQQAHEVVLSNLYINDLRNNLFNSLGRSTIPDLVHHTNNDIFFYVYFSETEDINYLVIDPINPIGQSMTLRSINMKGNGLLWILYLVYHALGQGTKNIMLWVWPAKREWISKISGQVKVRDAYESYWFVNNSPIIGRFDYAMNGQKINHRMELNQNPWMHLDLNDENTLHHLLQLLENFIESQLTPKLAPSQK